ncbi:retrovirus-related pol polyprotein from transposon TNT 1-94 [Tanacetum coccineum]
MPMIFKVDFAKLMILLDGIILMMFSSLLDSVLMGHGLWKFCLSGWLVLVNGSPTSVFSFIQRLDQKSHLLGVGIPDNCVAEAAKSIGCLIMKAPFKYLGILVGDNMSSKKAWDETINKMKKRLSRMQKIFLFKRSFFSADKALTGTLMAELTTMKFDGSKSMQQHVFDMTNTTARLRHKNIDELSNKLIQEEARLKKHRVHSVNLVNQGVDKKLKPKSKNFKKKQHATTSKVANGKKREQQNNKCNFYRKEGHFQKDCLKRKAWFENKGIHYVSVCFELNLSEVPSNTWWFDSGATTYVSNIMNGFLTIQTISPTNNLLFMGNQMKAPIEGVGTYRLKLDIGFHLDLMNTLYVPSISRNLISISRLDVSGYIFSGGNGRFNLYKNRSFIGYGILIDNLYKLKLDDIFLNLYVGMNPSMVNESSAFLWHKRLGHIYKKRLQILVKNEILSNLDFTDFGLCVECIMDDFSHYGYVYLLHEKSQCINALEVFVNKVERQLDRKVNIERSDIGGEYYGKYDESGQCLGPFAKFLENRGICAQYTMSGTPQQNGVAERQNRTLMEMVGSMITEAQVYNLQEKKLDSQTVSGYFIGYPEKSKGYSSYCQNHGSKIVETRNAKFLKNVEIGGSVENQVVDINEIRDDDPSPMNVHKSTTTPDVVPVFQNQEQHLNNEQTPHEENNLPTQTNFDIGIDNDPVSFSQAIKSDKFEMWIDVMKEKLKSMAQNKVWDLVNMPEASKPIGCKWVFKTKRTLKTMLKDIKLDL